MLEEMNAFFRTRLEGYDQLMMDTIVGAEEFYPYTASLLPAGDVRILDLGCGTGLELEYAFAINPHATVTGIDLSPDMLAALRRKFQGKALTLVEGSYFDVPFGECLFDAAVSVESLHHFTAGQKLPLYQKLRAALKSEGYFLLTDYFAGNDEEETFYFSELKRLKAEQGITDEAFYHYDTPLTAAHETEVLLAAGFRDVKVLRRWENTCTIQAMR